MFLTGKRALLAGSTSGVGLAIGWNADIARSGECHRATN